MKIGQMAHTVLSVGAILTVCTEYFTEGKPYDAMLVSVPVTRRGPCSAEIQGKIINLEPLKRTDGKPRFLANYTTEYNAYQYSFNPCVSYNEPAEVTDPSTMFGDLCPNVSMCKFFQEEHRTHYFPLGKISTTRFSAHWNRVINKTVIVMHLLGEGSFLNKETIIELMCDRQKVDPDDGIFKVLYDTDEITLHRPMETQLHHACACLDGCVPSKPNLGQSNDELAEDSSSPALLLVVAGVNIGLLIMAIFIGGLCYNKRATVRAYNKLPGLHLNPNVLVSNGSANHRDDPLLRPLTGRMISFDYEPNLESDKKSMQPVLKNCEIPLHDLELGQRLGGGRFADTYMGHWDEMQIAVKRITHGIKDGQFSPEVHDDIKNIIVPLSQQRHKNIVSLIGVCLEGKFPYIINEFFDGESVKDHLRKELANITWTQRVRICIQAADGMAYLHSQKPSILHIDLRCANLLITPSAVVKVVDFGATRVMQCLQKECKKPDCFCQDELTACPASIRWTAPEIFACTDSVVILSTSSLEPNDVAITTSCDVYSFGMIMWEMIEAKDPFTEISSEQEVLEIVKGGGRPIIPQSSAMMSLYRDLIKACWERLPEKRPSFKQVVSKFKEILYQARSVKKTANGHTAANPTRAENTTGTV